MSEGAAAATVDAPPLSESDNAAWASVSTPLSVGELTAFCREDIERLFRINPYLEFTQWSRTGEFTYRFSGVNYSRSPPFAFDLSLEIEPLPTGVSVHYREGIKKRTVFLVEPSPHGSTLSIREEYRQPPEGEPEEGLEEVDRSIETWTGDIQRFLLMWSQWRWLKPWRWYMDRVWKPMKPSGRRIAYILWWITLVEIALIVLGTGIYWVEYR